MKRASSFRFFLTGPSSKNTRPVNKKTEYPFPAPALVPQLDPKVPKPKAIMQTMQPPELRVQVSPSKLTLFKTDKKVVEDGEKQKNATNNNLYDNRKRAPNSRMAEIVYNDPSLKWKESRSEYKKTELPSYALPKNPHEFPGKMQPITSRRDQVLHSKTKLDEESTNVVEDDDNESEIHPSDNQDNFCDYTPSRVNIGKPHPVLLFA